MMDYQYDKDQDNTALWVKDAPPGSLSGLSRYKRWLFPALIAVVILILIIALGATNAKTSNHLRAMEKSVSNLTNVIQSLNASLQHAQAEEARRLQFAVDSNKDQLASVSEALKQLSVLNSLSKTVLSLKCSLERIINNSTVGTTGDGCCPLGWDQFDSNCYFFSSLSLSWNDSRVWCEQHQAHLVILHNDKAWDYVTARTIPLFYWVGLSDWRTGRWEWVNRAPHTIERRRWVPGQPDSWAHHGLGEGDEDCAHLHSNGRLNDLHCSTKMHYICQTHSMRG